MNCKGQEAEDLAFYYLKQQGLKLLVRNYLCRYGEIDLIMQEQQKIIFIEVRHRNQTTYGGSLESITFNKQRKLLNCARYYLQKMRTQPCRFDLIAINGDLILSNIQWVKNIFMESR
jgi:putative endonuclease